MRLDPSVSMALGYDWLSQRNPLIDWRAGTITFPADTQTKKEVTDTPTPALPSPCIPHIEIVSAAAFAALAEDAVCIGSVSEFAEPARSAKETTTSDEEMLPSHIPSCYHDFANIFSKIKADKLPPHRPYDHSIELEPGSTVPFGPIYRLSETELQALRDFIEEFSAKGFIRPSKSPAGAPILFVKKKDGSLRLCVDYRGLNKITKKDRYPLPRIDKLLDRLRSAYVFSKLDLRSGYNLIRMKAGDKWKTAFRTRYGSFEFLVLHFGLTNAPATFQHFMNDTFRKFLDDFLGGYLNDLIIFTALLPGEPPPKGLGASDIPRHVEQVRTILQTMRENGLYANPKNCVFHAQTVDFLGYVVSPEGLSRHTEKTRVIADWPTPRNVNAVQSFLGFANFYRRFILHYSQITKPLTNLTRKDVKFIWSPACQKAFADLKTAFTSAPILAHFHPNRQIILETDASDYAIAAILSQENPETKTIHPIAFYSRTMSPAELNYEIYDKELLAIFAAFREWRSYLEGASKSVKVVTDHKNLEYFASTKLLTHRQARWSEFLSSFNYTVFY